MINSKILTGEGNHIKNTSTRMNNQKRYTNARYNIDFQETLALSHDRPIKNGVLKMGVWIVVILVGEFVVDVSIFGWDFVTAVNVNSSKDEASVPSDPPVTPVPFVSQFSSFSPVPSIPPISSIELQMSNCTPFERNIPIAA